MKILVCIPVLYNGVVLEECLSHLVNRPNVDILVLDNGADADVKLVLHDFQMLHGIKVWHNSTNEFVNRPWNDFINHFLDSTEYDHLCIMNSDLYLQEDWADILQKRWTVDPDEVLSPHIIDDKTMMEKPIGREPAKADVLETGPPGVFITLNRMQAKLVYPLPFDIVKIWFGDTYIYDLLRADGYHVLAPINFLAFHHWSTTLERLPLRDKLLEQDKQAWETLGKERLQQTIQKLKQHG